MTEVDLTFLLFRSRSMDGISVCCEQRVFQWEG